MHLVLNILGVVLSLFVFKFEGAVRHRGFRPGNTGLLRLGAVQTVGVDRLPEVGRLGEEEVAQDNKPHEHAGADAKRHLVTEILDDETRDDLTAGGITLPKALRGTQIACHIPDQGTGADDDAEDGEQASTLVEEEDAVRQVSAPPVEYTPSMVLLSHHGVGHGLERRCSDALERAHAGQ